jgi:hypothetical protein
MAAWAKGLRFRFDVAAALRRHVVRPLTDKLAATTFGFGLHFEEGVALRLSRATSFVAAEGWGSPFEGTDGWVKWYLGAIAKGQGG